MYNKNEIILFYINFKKYNFILYSIIIGAITIEMKLEIRGMAYLFPFKNLNFCTITEELTFYVKHGISFIWDGLQLQWVVVANLHILYEYHSNGT